MTRSRIGIAIGATAALLALGAGAAWANGGGHGHAKPRAAAVNLDPRGIALHTVTSYLGLTPAQLRAELASGKTLAQIADATPGKSAAGLVRALTDTAKTRLDKAVAAGKLTPAQEQAVLGQLQPAISAFVQGTPAASARIARLPGVKEALAYLGLTPAQILSELASGKTLAQIADSTPGKSAAGLIQTLTDTAKAKLDAAVSAGLLPAAREQAILSHLNALVTAIVNARAPLFGHR